MELDESTTNLCFDDILLVPKYSNVESRSDVSLGSILGNPSNPKAWIHLGIPIMTAPMEFINSNAMIEAIFDFGGMGFIQRFQNKEDRFKQFNSLSERIKQTNRIGFCISVEESVNPDFINMLLSNGIKTLSIDTAFGHTKYAIDAVKTLRSFVTDDIHIMIGTISSYEAYSDLMSAGADSVRVGIGGGSACITRVVTGFGVPMLGSIMDIYKNIKDNEVNGIIVDGGIKQTGDIVKSLAAGASAVMMGYMFAAHDECDGKKDGKFLFRGLASASIKIDNTDRNSEEGAIRHIEGVSGYLNSKGSVIKTLNQISENIRSGFSYCGSPDIKSFKNDCKFIKVSPQSLKESESRI
jgi:IMP dehydrogenase